MSARLQLEADVVEDMEDGGLRRNTGIHRKIASRVEAGSPRPAELHHSSNQLAHLR